MHPHPDDANQENIDFIGLADLAYLWVLYIIYAVSGAIVLIPSLTLPAAVAITLALLLTRIKKRERHKILATHYHWLRRTFWIGMGVYLSVVTVLTVVIAAPAIDTVAFMDALTNGTVTTTEQMNDLLMAQQPASRRAMIIACGAVFTLWWLWRCGAGMLALYRQHPVNKPDSWI